MIGGYQISDNKRNLWEVAGFPDDVTFPMLYTQFRRSGYAKAGVLRPVQKCWSTSPCIYDHTGDDEPQSNNTQFEKDVKKLDEKFGLCKILYALDYKQRVGRYGGVIIIADEKGKKNSSNPLVVAGGVNGIKRLIPVYESQIIEGTLITDMNSVEFGNPMTYSYEPNAATTRTKSNVSDLTTMHKSRVYVFAEGADDGSIDGTPALEAGFNDLANLNKVLISVAEGFYKNARQRLHINIVEENIASAMLNNDEQNEFDDKMKDFAAGFDAEFFTAGMDVKTLQATLAQPGEAIEGALNAFCVSMDIPKTVLVGFETGQRSSEENGIIWGESMNSRRENVVTPMAVGFLKHLVEIKAIAAPTNGIYFYWDDLTSPSESQKLDAANKMADINQKQYQSGGLAVFEAEELREKSGFAPLDYDIEGELEDDEAEE
jgi:hypothetical protein